MARISTSGSTLSVEGRFELADLRRFSAALYSLTAKLGYEDCTLDFGRATVAFPEPMAGVCAEALALRARNVEVSLTLPLDYKLSRLFMNAGWAHHIDPDHYGRSTYRGYVNLPLLSFANADEQQRVVDRLVDAIMCSVATLDRQDLHAIEWTLNELTDNVLVHADSPIGGLVQLSTFTQRRKVSLVVCDAGKGIPSSLRQGLPALRDDAEALEKAVQAGVTRDPAFGQGNGLYGTLQIARTSDGRFALWSGYASLKFESDELRLALETVPFVGTLVACSMDFSNPSALGDALHFGTRTAPLTGYIDTHFEDRTKEGVVFRLADEAASFGSRLAGTPVRTKLANLIHMGGGKVLVDLEGVSFVSSSFADEVFGKLFAALGPMGFAQALEFRAVSPTVQALIDRAIIQRSSQGR